MRKRSGRILWLPYMVWRRYYTGGSSKGRKEKKRKGQRKANIIYRRNYHTILQ